MTRRSASVVSLLIIAGLSACSETATSPSSGGRPAAAPASGGGSTADLLPGDTLRFTIQIDPNKSQSYDLGNGHTVYFPQGSVCDPAKSSYGPGMWDNPCPMLNAVLTEQVTAWIDSSGHPYEDFSPGIRFTPTKNSAKFVLLSLTDPVASLNPTMNIVWCPTTTSACVDESRSDPTEITQHDPATGKVWRRIKHFSGYNVAAGDEDAALMSRGTRGIRISTDAASQGEGRSGYILASGRDQP